MSHRRRTRAAAATPVAPSAPQELVCIRCELEYAIPHAQDGKCICVHPCPSLDGSRVLPGYQTPAQRYMEIIRDVVLGGGR